MSVDHLFDALATALKADHIFAVFLFKKRIYFLVKCGYHKPSFTRWFLGFLSVDGFCVCSHNAGQF